MELLPEYIESIKVIIEKTELVIQALDGRQLPRPTVEEISKFTNQKKAVVATINNGDDSNLLESIQYCAMYSFRLAQNLKTLNLTDIINEFNLEEMIKDGQQLQQKIQNRPTAFSASDEITPIIKDDKRFVNTKGIEELEKKIEALSLDMQRADERFRKDTNATN